MILLQKGKTLTRRDDDFSARRFKLAGQNLEERRFSGAVCTDQTVAAALCEFDVDIFKEGCCYGLIGAAALCEDVNIKFTEGCCYGQPSVNLMLTSSKRAFFPIRKVMLLVLIIFMFS